MRTLYLLRHAKSSWDDASLGDHDRPLAARGRSAAPVIGRFMAENGLVPDLVLCSTAVRTRETWSLVEPHLGDGIRVVYDDDLYGASSGSLIRVVRGCPDEVQKVLLIAHNPGIQAASLALAGSGPSRAMKKLRRKYPTGALVELSCDIDHWADVSTGGCRLERFVRPKDLPDSDGQGP